MLAAAAGFVGLLLRTDIVHPAHAALGVLGFALIYLGIGTVIGSIIRAPLEGSLAVVFIFLLDVFSGPGMASHASVYSVSRSAGEVLVDAATGQASPTGDWLRLGVAVALSLAVALLVFAGVARRRA